MIKTVQLTNQFFSLIILPIMSRHISNKAYTLQVMLYIEQASTKADMAWSSMLH